MIFLRNLFRLFQRPDLARLYEAETVAFNRRIQCGDLKIKLAEVHDDLKKAARRIDYLEQVLRETIHDSLDPYCHQAQRACNAQEANRQSITRTFP